MKRIFLTVGLFVAAVTSNFAADHEAWDISKIDTSKLPPASDQKDVTYEKDIAPLLKASCVRCHGSERPKAHLRLDSKEGILKGGEDKVVVAGNSAKSLIVAAAAQVNDDVAMPPKHKNRGPGGPGGGAGQSGQNAQARPNGPGGPGGHNFTPPKPLTKDQVGLLRAWIDQGAK
jgi:hypothetical protein